MLHRSVAATNGRPARLKTAFEKRIEQEAEGSKAARARPGLGGRGTGRCRPVVDLAATPQLERLASQTRSAGPVRPDATPVDAAIVRAVSLALQGRLDEAARLCGDAPRGTQLQARRHGCCGGAAPRCDCAASETWPRVLAVVRERAA